MRKFYEVKNVSIEDFDGKGMISDVDMKSNTVTGYFSRFGNVDLEGDMIMPGAFTKTIKERGREGKNLIFHTIDHKAHDTLSMLSKPNLYEKPDGGFFESTISDTTNGKDIMKLYRDEVINQHSFGFVTVKNEKKSNYNAITEVMMYEFSTVTLGMNPETPFNGFKGLKGDALIERYKLIEKCYNNGDYSDDVFPILKAQLQQLKEEIIQEYLQLKQADTTLPDIKTTEPDQNVKLLDAIQLLTVKHF